jgi:hypothetical protein
VSTEGTWRCDCGGLVRYDSDGYAVCERCGMAE